MIKTSWCYLAIIHLLITLYCLEVINSLSLILALYVLNIFPVLTILQQEYFPDLFNVYDGNDFYIIQQVQEPQNLKVWESFDTLPPEELPHPQVEHFDDFPLEDTIDVDEPSRVTIHPKSFVQRWRKKVLNPPKQFPLDRLSYLKAKYFTCENPDNFWIQNSHLKQLVTKDDYRPYEEYEDDPHPMKMVNLSAPAYIHRRAQLYKKRKATIVDKPKQSTAHRGQRKSITSTVFEALSILKRNRHSDESDDSDDTEESITPEVSENIPLLMDEKQASSEELTTSKRPSMWKRISNVFSRRSSRRSSIEDEYPDYQS